MELAELRYFHNVAVAGSFVAGARLSHVSPPAISKAIRKLEDELGTELFVRTTRRVVLTEMGEALRDRCRRILDEIEEARRDVDELRSAIRGELRIGAMEVFSIHLLPCALSAIVRQHPELVPLTHEMIPQEMERLISEGRLDVGFTIGGEGGGDVEVCPLGDSPGVLVCGRRHPNYRKGRITPAELRTRPSVVPRFLGREHLPLLDQFPEHQHPRRVGATIQLLQMGLQLAVEGLYLGYFPEISVRPYLEDGRLRALGGLERQPPFVLKALTRRGGRPKAAVRLLLDELRRRIGKSKSGTRSVARR
jgi:DNA-binding transcriptional LysR family regulator